MCWIQYVLFPTRHTKRWIECVAISSLRRLASPDLRGLATVGTYHGPLSYVSVFITWHQHSSECATPVAGHRSAPASGLDHGVLCMHRLPYLNCNYQSLWQHPPLFGQQTPPSWAFGPHEDHEMMCMLFCPHLSCGRRKYTISTKIKIYFCKDIYILTSSCVMCYNLLELYD